MSSAVSFITQYVREAAVPSVYKNLSKFGSRFGVEIEVSSPLDWESIRNTLVPVVGQRNISDRAGGYGTGDNSYSKWQVTSDSSISTSGGFYGVELISPAFNIQTEADVVSVAAIIGKVFTHLKALGCKTNNSTGLHITMSCSGLSPSRFRPYVFCALADDLKLVRAFGRTRNTFCRPTTLTVRDMRLDFRKSEAHQALCSSQSNLSERGKYMSVNTSKLRRSTLSLSIAVLVAITSIQSRLLILLESLLDCPPPWSPPLTSMKVTKLSSRLRRTI
jgi:hypothetical protein